MGTAAIDAVTLGAVRNRAPIPDLADPGAYVQTDPAGIRHLHLFVNGLQCAACIRSIEGSLKSLDGITAARVNMSTGRLAVSWRAGGPTAAEISNAVQRLGYAVAPFDPATVHEIYDHTASLLLSSLAVAGFAAANVMLLSVSIWAGAFSDMGPGTRNLFHWISAAIALPAVIYAGRPFFHSAVGALRHRRMNMDVPISLAVLATAAMSLHQTVLGRDHAYFDASISLLFILLVGRYLDHQTRSQARSAASHILGLAAGSATVIDEDGHHHLVPVREVVTGAYVHVPAGGKIPVDGIVVGGRSTIDSSLVTGESLPLDAVNGTQLHAGTFNISAPLRLRTTAVGEDTLLAEIIRLMEISEHGRTKYTALADRAAALYAPLVHLLALAAFLGWWLIGDASMETSVMVAIAVLIITCPCALGLAVPAVQVVATGRLLRAGILAKAKDALERLATVDTVVFDKTGTLTLGRPEFIDDQPIDTDTLELASALAGYSAHPLSKAVVRKTPKSRFTATEVEEVPGFGLTGVVDGSLVRLGNAEWCNAPVSATRRPADLELWLRRDENAPVRLRFSDRLRDDARQTVAQLQKLGLRVELLSGDRSATVADVATQMGIDTWRARCLPTEKCARLSQLQSEGRRVLMVGDGLNDAPALAFCHASMAPASGSEISQSAADFVFQGEHLRAITVALDVARSADQRVKENIGMAVLYNVVAIPFALFGLVTPLIAATAMSTSSIIVTLNALRLNLVNRNP